MMRIMAFRLGFFTSLVPPQPEPASCASCLGSSPRPRFRRNRYFGVIHRQLGLIDLLSWRTTCLSIEHMQRARVLMGVFAFFIRLSAAGRSTKPEPTGLRWNSVFAWNLHGSGADLEIFPILILLPMKKAALFVCTVQQLRSALHRPMIKVGRLTREMTCLMYEIPARKWNFAYFIRAQLI